MTELENLGKITQEEEASLRQLRQRVDTLIYQVGDAEVRKARILGVLSETEVEMSRVMNDIGVRCGVPQGSPWNITPEGDVVLVKSKGE